MVELNPMSEICGNGYYIHHEPLDLEAIKQPFAVDDDGGYVTFCEEFRYLGSIIAEDAQDETDIQSRVKSATKAFGALSQCVFRNPHITMKAKKTTYEALVLSIMLYGSECWVPLERRVNLSRTAHRNCVRAITGVSLWQQRKYRISTKKLLQKCGLRSFRDYVDFRQLSWLGHVARMDRSRLPRKMLTAYVCNPRPQGGVFKNYGHRLVGRCGIVKARLGRRWCDWHALTQDRAQWRLLTRKACNMPPPRIDRPTSRGSSGSRSTRAQRESSRRMYGGDGGAELTDRDRRDMGL